MNKIIQIIDLVGSIADAIDLISPEVNNHHRRVTCIANYLGQECSLNSNQQENLITAAAVHDIGALTSSSYRASLRFDEDDNKHAINGFKMLREFLPLHHIAPIIKYHHAPWQKRTDDKIPLESRIIHLADRVAVLVNSRFTLSDVDAIKKKIAALSGISFQPDLVAVFMDLSRKEAFWLDARDAHVQPTLAINLARNFNLQEPEIKALGQLYSQMIDFRSRFTVTHSSGVAATSTTLARIFGFSTNECTLMQLAGDLHDLGKLVIPETILNKQGRLTPKEYNIIRSHTYYTHRLLLNIRAFDTIRVWASLHHERLNGSGYPFHYTEEQIPLGSRIMAVADVFTAITEDRPYRRGMNYEDVRKVLINMVSSGSLDKRVVEALFDNYQKIDDNRTLAQSEATAKYKAMEL